MRGLPCGAWRDDLWKQERNCLVFLLIFIDLFWRLEKRENCSGRVRWSIPDRPREQFWSIKIERAAKYIYIVQEQLSNGRPGIKALCLWGREEREYQPIGAEVAETARYTQLDFAVRPWVLFNIFSKQLNISHIYCNISSKLSSYDVVGITRIYVFAYLDKQI